MAPEPDGLDSARRVQDFANGVHQVCLTAGRADLANQLQREAGRYRASDTTVVVVGAEKAGKSQLVNALLGEAIVPVDFDVATSTYVELRHGRSLEVDVFHEGETEPRRIDPARLEQFATTAALADQRRVSGIVVHHPHPLLASGLVLVDTPGVGGLETAHGDLTLAALHTADMLLFVSEAGAPLGRSGLDFLEQATTRIDKVVFAVTKIDAFRGWRTIVDDNHELLRQHAARFADAPIIGVSAKLRMNARRLAAEGHDERADRALADSRLPALIDLLQRAVATSAELKLANLVRAGEQALAGAAEILHITVRSADADSTVIAELQERKQALNRVTQAAARWRLDLDSEAKALAFDFDAKVDVGIARLDQQLQKRIDETRDARLDSIVVEVDTALEALWIELGAYLSTEIDGIVDRLLSTLAIEGVSLTATELLVPEHLRETAGVRKERAQATDSEDWAAKLLQYYPIAFAAMMPVSLAGFAGIALGGPIAWIIGGGVAGAMFTARRKQAVTVRDRRAAMDYTRSTIADARKALSKQIAQVLGDTRRRLEDVISSALADQRTVLEQQLREHETLARQDTETRNRARQEANTALAQVATLQGAVPDLLARLADDRVNSR